MAEKEYKQQFQEFHSRKKSRNGEGADSRESGMNESSVFLKILFHGYGDNLVEIKS